MMGLPFGHPYTVDQAFNFVKNDIVFFGFPDILVKPTDSYQVLFERLSNSDADAILGLYDVEEPTEWDMVKADQNGLVLDILIKSEGIDYSYAWATIIWKPAFTEFLHGYLKKVLQNNENGLIQQMDRPRELIMSDVVNAAVRSGLKVICHYFPYGKVLDIGVVSRIGRAQSFYT